MYVFAGSNCAIPHMWRGSWYQGGQGAVTITADYLSHKGACVENDKDHYLIENKYVHFVFIVNSLLYTL